METFIIFAMMELRLKKTILKVIYATGLIILLVLIFRPHALIQGLLQEYNENRILIRYERLCYRYVRRVIRGGEEITASLRQSYPNIATDEVRFTEDSDEPKLHLCSAEFWTGGLAKGYQYIIEGEVVGVTTGVYDSCFGDEAHNEIVPEFRVTNWYVANYMPLFMLEDPRDGFKSFLLIIGASVLAFMLLVSFIANKRTISEVNIIKNVYED